MGLSAAGEQLRTERQERATIGRAIAELRRDLKRDTTWTPEERARQEGRLQEMLQDAQRIDDEMAGLKAHVRLLKTKLLLLRL